MKTNLRRLLLWLCAAQFLFFSPQAQAAPSVPPRDRILILLSLDAFRWDYLQKFHPTNLSKLAAEGAHAERLIPAFPSLTFPNHHTIATGWWPGHHGIIANGFYDPTFKTNFTVFGGNPNQNEPRWWGGEPIWVTAVKQGRVADCMYWPGVGAAIAGVRPTEWKTYAKDTTPNECVDVALGWLDQPVEKRPSLVTLYFHHTDTAGHHDGPDSPQLAAAVALVDEAVGRLVEGIHRLKLDDTANLVIVSDHGMTEVSTNRFIVLSDYVDLTKVQVDFSGAVGGLRPLDGNVDALYAKFEGKENHFKVYRKENMPEEFHFRDNDRIPPVILVADEGWYISRRPAASGREFEKATHGFDPKLESMGATFIAWGPAFQHGVTLAPVENVHIYNLLCATLGLKPAPNDGDDRLVKKALVK